MEEKKLDLRKAFLKDFIKQLIVESVEHLPKQDIPNEKILQEQITPNFPTNPMERMPIQKTRGPQQTPDMRVIKVPGNESRITEIGQKTENSQRPKPRTPLIKPKPGYIDLGKLNFIIADPWVQSIECQGPEKNVTVKKGNKILLTHVTLNEEEINKIIDEFSITTKIPLVEGTLKAVHNDLMITAVVSNILGGRFVIQKTNPNNLTI